MPPPTPTWLLPPPLQACHPAPSRNHSSRRTLSTPGQPSRIALQVQYNGNSFHGWESKPNLPTIQSALLDALHAITNTPSSITAASRTDAGAHAVGQTVHFDVANPPFANAHAWANALNRRLPPTIRVTRSAYASRTFDARRSAIWRHYRYTICTRSTPNVFLSPLTWHYYQNQLDISAMNNAAQYLLSDTPRDLSAFRKANAPASHTNIHVKNIAVTKNADLVQLDVTADWFVYGMMRLLAATLLQVGTGNMSVAQFALIVEEKRRQQVRFSAPASGLCLMRVEYPSHVNPFRDIHIGEDGANVVQPLLQQLELPS